MKFIVIEPDAKRSARMVDWPTGSDSMTITYKYLNNEGGDSTYQTTNKPDIMLFHWLKRGYTLVGLEDK